MVWDNTGNKYTGNQGQILLAEEGGSPADVPHVVNFTATETAADVDMSEQNSDFTDGDVGQKTLEVQATIFRSKEAPLLRVGIYEVELIFDEQPTTDGKIAGTFRVTSVGVPHQLNNGVSYNVRMVSKGAYTVTDPAAI